MSDALPSRPRRRLPLFIQVAVGAWIIVAILAGFLLHALPGSIAQVTLLPLAAQTATGAALHGGVVLFADRRYMLSPAAAMAFGAAATLVGAAAFFDARTWSVYLLTLTLAELSAILGWYFVRREVSAARPAG